MDSYVSPKDKIWFLRVCHHISNAVYLLRARRHNRTQCPLRYCCDKQQVTCNGTLNNTCTNLVSSIYLQKGKINKTRHTKKNGCARQRWVTINEIWGFSDQGGATVVVAAGTSVSLALPVFPTVFLFVKEQKLEQSKEQTEGDKSWLLPSNAWFQVSAAKQMKTALLW